MLKDARRKIAGWILGDDTALFLSKKAVAALDKADYLALDDEQLAAVTRRWFAATAQIMIKKGREKDIPVTVMQNEYAVLGLAKFLKDANADTATLSVKGTVDGGQTTEDFIVEVKRLPHNPARWLEPLGVETTEAEDGRITHMSIRYSHDKADANETD